MNCAKCGLDLPPGTRQCPKCGLMNEFEKTASPNAPHKKRMLYGMVGLAAVAIPALVLAVVVGRGPKNVTSGPDAKPGPSALMSGPAPGAPGGNVMGGPPGTPASSAPAPPSGQKPKPPQQVVDYLNYVKGVEQHRQMLLKDTTNALTLSQSGESQGLMDLIDAAMDPEGGKARDPLKSVRDELSRQYKNWYSTMDYFDKKPAPAECREFSGAYRDVLYRETKTIGDIAKNLSGVNMTDAKDMSRLLGDLQKLKGDPSIQAGIDQSADNADKKLDIVVAQYDMEKPFNVPREQQTSGSIMGF